MEKNNVAVVGTKSMGANLGICVLLRKKNISRGVRTQMKTGIQSALCEENYYCVICLSKAQ